MQCRRRPADAVHMAGEPQGMAPAQTVLVVEDDMAIQMLLTETLRIRGYAPVAVGDGLAAHPAALEHRPDVVLLDIGLPGLDGFGVLELLKADDALRDVPVIMVTAWAEPELVRRALDRGAHDYVKKPFAIDELMARVDAAARTKARQDELNADNDRLSEMALVDPLTGLPNRRSLTDALERQVAECTRSGRQFAALMLDVDGFKATNDTHGHAVGDAVLGAVARRLAGLARGADVLGRWAGDELLVIAPDTDVRGAQALGDRLRTAIGEQTVDTPGAAVRTTVSVGVAVWEGESAEQCLARCDAALYEAKAAGRDRVQLAASGEAPPLRAVA
jgi:two-component system cell cycle response regulator